MPVRINEVWAFNDKFTMLWKRAPPVPDGLIVIVDVSHSMNCRRAQLKAAFSAALALDPDAPRIDLPPLNHHTRLYGCCEWLMNSVIGTEQKMLVITDGDDTHHADSKIKTGIDADGHWTFTELEYPGHGTDVHEEYIAYCEKRRDTILEYFAACDVEWFLVGLGEEVKDLCRKAAHKRNMTVAAIADEANIKEIVATVHTAVRNSRRKKIAEAAEAGEDEPAPIIYEADTPAVVAAEREDGFEQMVTKVGATASKVAFGEALPLARLKEMFMEAETQAGLEKDPTEAIEYRRRAVLWFLELAGNEPDGARIPGALLGAQWSSIWIGPEGHQGKAWFRSMNQLLSKLRDAGVLSDGKGSPEKWSKVVEGLEFKSPSQCAMYGLGKGVRPAVVRELLADKEWGATDTHLLLRGDGTANNANKRKAEDAEPDGEADAVPPESQADDNTDPHPGTLGIKAPRLSRTASCV